MGETPLPAGASDEDERVDGMVADALAELETGGEAALERFLGDHAADAPRVRSRVESLRARGLLEAPATQSGAVPERIGDFRLIRELGSGGMGVVYLAEQIPLKRRVALKLMHPSHLYFPHARARFQREIETVARLNHPGIVPIYLVGEDHGLPWFAMEHVEGCSLADVVRAFTGADPRRLSGADLRAAIQRIASAAEPEDASAPREPPPSDEIAAQRVFSGTWTDACLRLLGQVAEALAHAHARGVLHRDVKPSNIMVNVNGRARLVDFGLALLEGSNQLTRSGTNPGSLPYMSPEQISSRPEGLDVRTDVYSLGVTLYELLTLKPAFGGESTEITRRRILTGDAPRPRAWHRRLDRDVETVCLKAIAPERDLRYATAADLAHDLEAAREGRPISARRPGPVYAIRRFVRIHPVETLAAAALAASVLAAVFGGEFEAERKHDRDLSQVESVLHRVLDACARNELPKSEDLALVSTLLEDPVHREAFDLLRTPPRDARLWDELKQLLPGSVQGSAPSVSPESPLAGITETLPLFRFYPPPPDGRAHRYSITISAPDHPDRTLTVEQGAEETGALAVALDGEPLDVGVDYVWEVRRDDAAADAAAPVRAEFRVIELAEVERKLAGVDTGEPVLDQLMRAAVLLHLGAARRALQELVSFPPDATADNQGYRLLLEARAYVLLADAEGFAAKHAEAQERAAAQ